MDSLTQIVLGAAVGEFLAGHKIGRKAPLIGALAGTIPDLDVLFGLITDPVTYLSIHRGFSHSIFFPFVAAPVLAWLTQRYWPSAQAGLRDWLWVYFWVLFTHPLLDVLTGYGTQLLNPFSNYAFEVNSIFIIDPLYTLPLATLLLLGIRLPRDSGKRRTLVKAGLLTSTSWLAITIILKLSVTPVFKAELDRQNLSYVRMMTVPGPFSSLLWRALVETDDGYLQGYYSVFDSRKKPIAFHFTPRNEQLLDGIRETEAAQRLLWFSKGYFTATESPDGILFNDLRFGSYSSWSGEWDSYIFTFVLQENAAGAMTFNQVRNPVEIRREDFSSLFRRTFAREAASALASQN